MPALRRGDDARRAFVVEALADDAALAGEAGGGLPATDELLAALERDDAERLAFRGGQPGGPDQAERRLAGVLLHVSVRDARRQLLVRERRHRSGGRVVVPQEGEQRRDDGRDGHRHLAQGETLGWRGRRRFLLLVIVESTPQITLGVTGFISEIVQPVGDVQARGEGVLHRELGELGAAVDTELAVLVVALPAVGHRAVDEVVDGRIARCPTRPRLARLRRCGRRSCGRGARLTLLLRRGLALELRLRLLGRWRERGRCDASGGTGRDGFLVDRLAVDRDDPQISVRLVGIGHLQLFVQDLHGLGRREGDHGQIAVILLERLDVHHHPALVRALAACESDGTLEGEAGKLEVDDGLIIERTALRIGEGVFLPAHREAVLSAEGHGLVHEQLDPELLPQLVAHVDEGGGLDCAQLDVRLRGQAEQVADDDLAARHLLRRRASVDDQVLPIAGPEPPALARLDVIRHQIQRARLLRVGGDLVGRGGLKLEPPGRTLLVHPHPLEGGVGGGYSLFRQLDRVAQLEPGHQNAEHDEIVGDLADEDLIRGFVRRQTIGGLGVERVQGCVAWTAEKELPAFRRRLRLDSLEDELELSIPEPERATLTHVDGEGADEVELVALPLSSSG